MLKSVISSSVFTLLIGMLFGLCLVMIMPLTKAEAIPPRVEHCLDVYSGGRLIWEGKAERTPSVSSDGVEFINKITNEPMIVHSDFVYYVCREVSETVGDLSYDYN